MKRRLIAAVCLLIISLMVISALSKFTESSADESPAADDPSYRGKSATYWAKAMKTAACDDNVAITSNSTPGWATHLGISFRGCQTDPDLWNLLFSGDVDGIPVLIRLLEHKDPHIRRFAAHGIGGLHGDAAPGAEAAIPALIITLKDSNASVRHHAVRSLEKFGPRAKDAVPVLIQTLKDYNRDIRMDTMHCLGAIGPEAREAVLALIQFLRSDDAHDRDWAAYALGGIGPEAKSAVPDLLKLLINEKDRRVSDSVYYALDKNDPKALADALRQKNGK